MIIFKLNLFMHKKRIKTNIFGVSLKRQALYPPLRHILEGNVIQLIYLIKSRQNLFVII